MTQLTVRLLQQTLIAEGLELGDIVDIYSHYVRLTVSLHPAMIARYVDVLNRKYPQYRFRHAISWNTDAKWNEFFTLIKPSWSPVPNGNKVLIEYCSQIIVWDQALADEAD